MYIIVHRSSWLIRGLIGPERQFGPASLYHPALYAMLLGAVLPLLVWLWARKVSTDSAPLPSQDDPPFELTG